MKQLRRRVEEETATPLTFIKCLALSYLVTAILIFVLAFVLYRMRPSRQVINIIVMFIYIIGSFLGGFLAGGKVKEKKFLFGLMMGGIYFAVLLLVSLLMNGGLEDGGLKLLTTFMLCAGGGMIGGMVR